MMTWQLDVYLQVGATNLILCKDHNLEPPTSDTFFSGMTVNLPLGKQNCVKCDDHRDCTNVYCLLEASACTGEFNSKTGGHLILYELGIILEFPPGSIIAFPPALITHANVSIAPSETRSSVALYTMMNLVRKAMGDEPIGPIYCKDPWTRLKWDGKRWRFRRPEFDNGYLDGLIKKFK